MKSFRIYLLLAGILLSLVSPARAEVSKLVVSDVSVSPSTMTVVLNKQLEIRDIRIADNKLVLPQDITILSQELNDQILSACQTGKPTPNAVPGSISYKITDIYKVADTSSSVKAQVSVVFNEALSVKIHILNSEKGHWVGWPTQLSIRKDYFQISLGKNILKMIDK